MNKVLVTSAVTAFSFLSATSFSNPAFDGFYLGASAGYSSLDAKEKIGIFNERAGSDMSSDTSPRQKSNNFIGMIHAGYGMSFRDTWYMGAELFAGYDNHQTKYSYSYGNNDDRGQVQDVLARKYVFGLHITPGFYLKQDVQILLKPGINFSRFEYKIQDRFVDTGGDGDSLLSTKESKMTVGFNLGGAMKIAMTEKLSLRLDIDHTRYRNFRISKTQSNDHKSTTNVKPTTTTIVVGFGIKL
jgi:opacity protein-like surface antigen